MDFDTVRSMALALPEVSESPHHHLTSFRVGGKILATAPPEEDHIRVFVGEEDRQKALAVLPDAITELTWGKQTVGVAMNVAGGDPTLLAELLLQAWKTRAPATLVASFDAAGYVSEAGLD